MQKLSAGQVILAEGPEESEGNLVARCRRGDAVAWEAFFERYHPALGRFVFQLSPDLVREDVEEICQDAFIAVVHGLAQFRGRSSVQTWLFRIAVNKARDYLDRARAAKRGGGRVPVSLDAADAASGLVLDPPSGAPGPADELLAAERGRLVRTALDRLGDPCREILELRYFGDSSYEEIGAALDLNLKTVSSRLSKCLDRLERVARAVLAERPDTSRGEKPGRNAV